MSGIYIASRTRHAAKWREARDNGIPIISTWIDEAGEGESCSMSSLWWRCVKEAASCSALVLYREDGEMLKGALVEAGAALGDGKPVFAVGFDLPDDLKEFSFLYHPYVTLCASVEIAFSRAECRGIFAALKKVEL